MPGVASVLDVLPVFWDDILQSVKSLNHVCCDVLDSIQRFGERLGLAVVELDVVARGRACLQPDGLTDDEGDGFGLGLPHGLAGGSQVATMQ